MANRHDYDRDRWEYPHDERERMGQHGWGGPRFEGQGPYPYGRSMRPPESWEQDWARGPYGYGPHDPRRVGAYYGPSPERGLWDRTFIGRGPKGYTRSDERIRENICELLTEHPWIDATDIEVVVRGGEVTLTGMVDDRRMKRLAADVAENVFGVRDVHNQIRVRRDGERYDDPRRTSSSSIAPGRA